MRHATRAFIASLALLGAGAWGEPAQAQEKVLLAHALPRLAAGYGIASSLPDYLGYWKEEGLDVEVVTNRGSAAAIQLVIGGRADVAWGNPTTGMKAVQQGEDLKFYYSSLRGDIFGIAIPKGSDIKELSGLKGKTIGVSSFASGGANYGKALLASAGLKEGDYDMIEVGVGARAAAALKSDQVQALSLWDSAYKSMEFGGIEFAKIVQDPRAASFIAGSMTVKTEDLEKRRKMLIGLARGIAKAQIFQEVNPEAAVRIHWKVFPQTAPREGVTDQAVAEEVQVVGTRTKIKSRNILGTDRFGDVPVDDMKKFQSYLVLVGDLEKEIDVNRYYTNEMIDEINDFDREAIIEQAKSYKMPE